MTTQAIRVVSLLPSATDTVVALKAETMLVGRTHECDWPSVAAVSILTSNKLGDLPPAETDLAMAGAKGALAEAAFLMPHQAVHVLADALSVYRTDLFRLAELKPTVILTSLQGAETLEESGTLSTGLGTLLGYSPQVVHLAANNLQEAWEDVLKIAGALGMSEAGEQLVQQLQRRMSGASAAACGRPAVSVACIQWPDPWFAGGSWVPELIRMAGGVDVLGRVDEAVQFSPQQLVQAAPDVVLFALCGYKMEAAASEAEIALERLEGLWDSLPAFRRGRVLVMDGVRLFSRPGPLLADTLEALIEALHPEAQPFGHQGTQWRYLQWPLKSRDKASHDGELGAAGQDKHAICVR